jgi:hypothetical protein
MTSTSSTTTATATTTKPTSNHPKIQPETPLDLSANFANNRKFPVGYDHEVYLQLTAGKDAEKTPNQVYREVGFIKKIFFGTFSIPPTCICKFLCTSRGVTFSDWIVR